MGKFKDFLLENEDLKQQIFEILRELSEEEIGEFGEFLYYEFFDSEDTDEDDYDFFDIDDVKGMIDALGVDFYEDILYFLLPDESDIETADEEENEDELDEGVARIMKVANINKKKRKFMAKSQAELRQTKAQRARERRSKIAKTKRYYKANKTKIASYQKSRSQFIKKGKHNVKLRRKAG